MPEINCSTCSKDDNRTGKPCPTMKTCFFPDYKEWEPIGAEKEDTGCPKCSNWKALGIGTFCGEKL